MSSTQGGQDMLSRIISLQRLKLLRLFVYNDDVSFFAKEVAFRTRLPDAVVRKELNTLAAADFLKVRTHKGKKEYRVHKKNHHFPALARFIRETSEVSDARIVEEIKKCGNIRLIAISGLFTGAMEPKIDLLVVGDKIEEKRLTNSVHIIEAELGREIRYASFSTEDFRYRLGVYDRLLRDTFDYAHRFLVNKLGI